MAEKVVTEVQIKTDLKIYRSFAKMNFDQKKSATW